MKACPTGCRGLDKTRARSSLSAVSDQGVVPFETPQSPKSPIRVDAQSLFRAPVGTDEELLSIFLKYNDVLLKRGVSTFNIWMKRAHYLYGLGRYEDAVDAIQEALVHDPASADAHFMLGVNLQLLGLEATGGKLEDPLGEESRNWLEAAALAFKATLELNPADEEANGYLVNLRCLLHTPGETTAAPA